MDFSLIFIASLLQLSIIYSSAVACLVVHIIHHWSHSFTSSLHNDHKAQSKLLLLFIYFWICSANDFHGVWSDKYIQYIHNKQQSSQDHHSKSEDVVSGVQNKYNSKRIKAAGVKYYEGLKSYKWKSTLNVSDIYCLLQTEERPQIKLLIMHFKTHVQLEGLKYSNTLWRYTYVQLWGDWRWFTCTYLCLLFLFYENKTCSCTMQRVRKLWWAETTDRTKRDLDGERRMTSCPPCTKKKEKKRTQGRKVEVVWRKSYSHLPQTLHCSGHNGSLSFLHVTPSVQGQRSSGNTWFLFENL